MSRRASNFIHTCLLFCNRKYIYYS